MGTDRVLTTQMEFPADGPSIKVYGFDVGTGLVEQIGVDAEGKPQAFDRSVALAFKPLLQKVSTSLGTLKVVPSVAAASVEVLGRALGTGTVEKQVPAGTLRVKVTAPDYLPFEADVVVEAKGNAELNAQLAPKASALPPPSRVEPEPAVPAVKSPAAPSTPVYKRPGLYVALGGVAVLAAGLVVGISAKNIEKKAKDASGGIANVTRGQAIAAQRNGKIGTGLIAAGGAIAAGGVLWFSLEPVFATGPKAKAPVKEPGAPSGEPLALMFTVGGEF